MNVVFYNDIIFRKFFFYLYVLLYEYQSESIRFRDNRPVK